MYYASDIMVSASMPNIPAIWLVLMVLLLLVEAAVPGLVSIWFAIGALAAMLSSLLGAPFWLQLIWFMLISLATLLLTRPLIKKYVNSRVQPTNADALIGRDGLVIEEIDNLNSSGAVKVRSQIWSARAENDGDIIPDGAVVSVLRIEGVKLIVRFKEE